jgi:flagellar biosynthesis protein FlhF
MEIKTYRARSLQEALRWIQRDLGPDAAVLHTRELRSGLMEWLRGRQLEVTAGVGVPVPSQFPESEVVPGVAPPPEKPSEKADEPAGECVPSADGKDYRDALHEPSGESVSLVGELCEGAEVEPPEFPAGLQQLLMDLIDAEIDEESARELVHRVRGRSAPRDLGDAVALKARLARLMEEEIQCAGPISVPRSGRRIVALVGPTGVGKTTTIAKLAAHFHLRQNRRVGLVTVDTYRVAAVDQLRTYADIIDLPLEVVDSPRAMRAALAKLDDRELILLDTAGHSPGDEVRMQELRSLVQESEADDVQLVISGVATASSLKQATARFAAIGATGLILTKLDEMAGMGHLWPMLRQGRLPLSYITTGQNVPDDFAAADARKIARRMLRLDEGQ